MSLLQQLREDLKDAMRARDDHRKSALRMVLTEVQLAEVESSSPLSDEDVIVLIRKEVKRREEAVEMMRDGGRDELVDGEMRELEILRDYLPKMMTEGEVTALAKDVIAEVEASSMREMGAVMGAIMPRVRGRADGQLVNQVVRKLLSA
ncbi:MAG: GatB/YqeY domain-containing protein [Anaerolineae bacterium]|nr:GatB/YqeY domain-containing protein [Anaerolineae bacterium]